MLFLIAGIALLALKYLEVGPIAGMSWYIVMAPFPMAVIWWWWSDKSGRTKRLEVEKMDKRRTDRIERQREQMGMLSAKRKKK
ncbi:MAG: TIGR04438 family Trp-rich protein [Pseudomonadota bacterium]|uniref:TIGR04438 family Trp-rich protein n=1 Tax=Polaromonas sp. TaxID=1869339 RepID=UPI0025EF7CF1|nr:TIGR04438 family Trp-rich protein [Polaromonas sp.]MBI2728892.1 TIGR04438 family Trp-rich protein [Polaromonas sp.]